MIKGERERSLINFRWLGIGFQTALIAVVKLHTFYLGKLDLLTVYKEKFGHVPSVTYLGKILSSGAYICLENDRISLDSYLKAIAREK